MPTIIQTSMTATETQRAIDALDSILNRIGPDDELYNDLSALCGTLEGSMMGELKIWSLTCPPYVHTHFLFIMRKVDQEMITAIRNFRPFSKGNRCVTWHDNGSASITFHGHLIGAISNNSISINNCGYWTATTKQILNVLLFEFCGYNVFQRKFDWFISTPEGEVEYTGDWWSAQITV